MTIDSDWVEVMKGECPEAFTAAPPFAPRAAYIDGMPLLMAAGATRRWDDLVKRNFANPISRYFRMGASTVVLAFDDYKYVPSAKSITQANRSKGKAVFQFNERQHLETVMPGDYNERLCNRAYKRRVIDLIVETVPEHARLQVGQRLVIDYVDCPVVFDVDPSTRKPRHSYMTDIPPMGECDVKFTRWARMLGDLIAHSVDGDFIPIALMEYEREVNALFAADRGAGASQRQQGGGPAPTNIAIFRMEYRMERAPPRGTPTAGTARKRDRGGRPVSLTAVGGRIQVTDAHGASVHVAGAGPMGAPAGRPPRAPRKMEYVNVPMLFQAMREAMLQCTPTVASRGDVGSAPGSHMRVIAALIALTGTDFTRKLPQITPKRVWELLPVRATWSALEAAFDADASQWRVDEACDALIANLYALKFCKHVPSPCPGTMEAVLDAIHRSKLSEKTKAQMPSRLRIEATVRNANWVLQYWECRQPSPAAPPAQRGEGVEQEEFSAWDYSRCFPDPVCGEYGFRRSKARKDAVQWLDVDDAS